MMLRLNILNAENFLQTVNECEGKVNLFSPDGKKQDINKQYSVQSELLQCYKKNNNSLHVFLEVEKPSDYMRIVSYYAGDC